MERTAQHESWGKGFLQSRRNWYNTQAACCLLPFFFFCFFLNTPDFERPAVSFLMCSVGVQPADDYSLMALCVCERAHERGSERYQTENPQGDWTLPGSPHSHCFDRLLTEQIFHHCPLRGTRSPRSYALDTHTHTRLLRVNPTADLRILEILPGGRNVSISLATRLEAGQRITEFSYTPPKIYRSSLIRVTGKAGFGLLTPLAPEWGGEMLLLGWPCIFTLISMSGNYLNQVWTTWNYCHWPFRLLVSLYIPCLFPKVRLTW